MHFLSKKETNSLLFPASIEMTQVVPNNFRITIAAVWMTGSIMLGLNGKHQCFPTSDRLAFTGANR